MSQQFSPEELRDMITMIQEEGRNLTKWEEDFVESVSDQLERNGGLSALQVENLDRIYTEKTP